MKTRFHILVSWIMSHPWWSGASGLITLAGLVFTLLQKADDPFLFVLPNKKIVHSREEFPIPIFDEPNMKADARLFVGSGSALRILELKERNGVLWAKVRSTAGWIAVLNLKRDQDWMVDVKEFAKGLPITITYGGSDGLNLRDSPSLEGDRIMTLHQHSKLRVRNDPIDSDTHKWVQVGEETGFICIGSRQAPTLAFSDE